MFRSLTVTLILFLSICLCGCGSSGTKIPSETEDYVMKCGCFGGYGNQPDLVNQLESIGAFGFHELDVSPNLPMYEGSTSFVEPILIYAGTNQAETIKLRWKINGQIYESVVNVSEVTIVLEETAVPPEVRWKWTLSTMQALEPPELDDIGFLASNHTQLITIRMTSLQYSEELYLPKPQ